jgi:hypothetical protein
MRYMGDEDMDYEEFDCTVSDTYRNVDRGPLKLPDDVSLGELLDFIKTNPDLGPNEETWGDWFGSEKGERGTLTITSSGNTVSVPFHDSKQHGSPLTSWGYSNGCHIDISGPNVVA